MSANAHKTVFWCRLPIVAAALCFSAACFSGFSLSYVFLSAKHLMATALVAAGSFFAALGIREFAGLLFNMEDKPWFGRWSGALFLAAMLTPIIFVTLVVTSTRLDHRILRAIPFHQLPYLIAGFTLLSVVFLDWPEKIPTDICTKPQRTSITTPPTGSYRSTQPAPASGQGVKPRIAHPATIRQTGHRKKGVLSKDGVGSTKARLSK